MVNIIRRFQQPLMIAITILVIISFVWLYNNNTKVDRFGGQRAATIYGREVSIAELQRNARKLELTFQLGLFELAQGLVGRAQRDQMHEAFAMNSIIPR